MSDGDVSAASTGKAGRFVGGFVAGVVITGSVMGFFWFSQVSQRDAKIASLNAQISERDGTIQTLTSQLERQTRN